MPSLNKVMIIGNLTRDVELRYTPKGSAVADISLAINRSYSTDSGEKREEVTYVDVVLWAKLAELAGQYLRKGVPVFIEGRLQMETWDDKATGQKRSKMKVVGESMQFLGRPPEGSSQPPAAQQQRRANPPAQHWQKPPPAAPKSDDFGDGSSGFVDDDPDSIPF